MGATGKWYNNGIINKRFKENELIPEGWVKGQLPRSEEAKKQALEKRKQTNIQKFGTEFPLQSKEVKEQMKQKSLKKWGTEHPMQSQEMKDKYKEIFIEKYGVENPSQSQEVQDKKKQTSLSKYGTKHPMQSQVVKDKVKQKVQENYGVGNPFQSEEIKEKSKQTMLKNYNVEHPLQSNELKEKARKTNLERYGTRHAMQSDRVKDKVKQTNLSKYGVENPFQSEGIKNKIMQTSIEKYGTEYPNQSQEVKSKIVKTSLEHWGTENPMQSQEVQDMLKKSVQETYGVDYAFQAEEVKSKIQKTMSERYGTKCYPKTQEFKDKVLKTCQEKYGVDWPCQLPEVRSASSNDSSPNRGFASLLDKYNISYEREFNIGHYSYDFKVGNTLIEINPSVTHNVLWSPYGENHITQDYHKNKTLKAEEGGYRCIHIFEWDNPEKIIQNILIQKETEQARKTKVFGIDSREASEILTEHHIQGSCNGQEVRLGLRDRYGNLVSLMSFGKSRYNKNYQWELLRYVSTKNITGGAKKLFKHFIENYNPESIISYCDRSKFIGSTYINLGFTLKASNNPSRHWYSPKEKRHITDNFLRQRGYDQIFNESYGKGTSNEELIVERGYLPVYDCGQDTYVWVK